jgi:AcrR family transcriptional regulator
MAARPRTERKARPLRRPPAKARLTKALTTLIQRDGENRAAPSATVAELCRLADVSRNSLYRYHADILKGLRKHQCRRPSAAQSKAVKSDERRRIENIALREHISALAALVDHHYAAYREASALLERRDRDLAELRRRFNLRPTPINS